MNKYGIFSIPSSERTCHVSSPVSFFRGLLLETVDVV